MTQRGVYSQEHSSTELFYNTMLVSLIAMDGQFDIERQLYVDKDQQCAKAPIPSNPTSLHKHEPYINSCVRSVEISYAPASPLKLGRFYFADGPHGYGRMQKIQTAISAR